MLLGTMLEAQGTEQHIDKKVSDWMEKEMEEEKLSKTQ